MIDVLEKIAEMLKAFAECLISAGVVFTTHHSNFDVISFRRFISFDSKLYLKMRIFTFTY